MAETSDHDQYFRADEGSTTRTDNAAKAVALARRAIGKIIQNEDGEQPPHTVGEILDDLHHH